MNDDVKTARAIDDDDLEGVSGGLGQQYLTQINSVYGTSKVGDIPEVDRLEIAKQHAAEGNKPFDEAELARMNEAMEWVKNNPVEYPKLNKNSFGKTV